MPESHRPKHWWQDWKWIAAFAAMTLGLGLATYNVAAIQTNDTIETRLQHIITILCASNDPARIEVCQSLNHNEGG